MSSFNISFCCIRQLEFDDKDITWKCHLVCLSTRMQIKSIHGNKPNNKKKIYEQIPIQNYTSSILQYFMAGTVKTYNINILWRKAFHKKYIYKKQNKKMKSDRTINHSYLYCFSSYAAEVESTDNYFSGSHAHISYIKI